MNGNKYIIDTNIILYLLGGNKRIANLLNNKEIYISFISELEVLGYKQITPENKAIITNFFNDCFIVDINEIIKTNVINIKRNYNIKLPDAIIGATAKFLDIPLITADKDFVKIDKIKLHLFNF